MKSLTFEGAGPNKQNKAIVYDIKPGTPYIFQSPLVTLFVCLGKNINLVQPLKNKRIGPKNYILAFRFAQST